MLSTLRLDKETCEQLGRSLVRLIEMDVRDRQSAAQKLRILRNIYDGDMGRTLRYPGQSDIHLQVLVEKIEGTIPKISQAFWGSDPVVHLKPAGEEHTSELTTRNEQFLDWIIQNDIPNFYASFQTWTRNMLIDSVSCIMPYYEFVTRNSVVVETVKLAWKAGDIDLLGNEVREARFKLPEEILTEVFGLGVQRGLVNMRPVPQGAPVTETTDDLPETGESTPSAEAVEAPSEGYAGLAFEVDFIDDRVLFEGARVELQPNRHIDEIDVVIFRPVVIRDGVGVRVIEWEDLIVPYRTEDIQTAERVARQYWLTIDQIRRKMQDGEWDLTEEDLTAMSAIARGERQEEMVENDELKQQKDDSIGEHSSQSGTGALPELPPYMDNKVLIFEVFCGYDVDGDGYAEEVILQIPYGLERVVRADYLDAVYPHGRRPFPAWHYIKLGSRWQGKSMAELLAPINIEVDAIINLVNDAQEVINNPWFFYQPAAINVDPGIFDKGLHPGQGVPVADPKGIYIPTFQNQPLANLSALDSLLMFADRLTLSPQSVGSSQVRNAPRTARGTLALLSEAGVKNDMLIEQAQRGGWRELVHQIHALYAAFGADEKYYRVTGADRVQKISRKELRGRYHYVFSGNTVNTNREVMRSISQVRYNTMAADPMFAMDLGARQELIKDFLKYFGEGADINKMIPRLPGNGALHAPLPQAEENQIMASGVPIEVLATDNHAEHLAEIDRFANSPRFQMLEEWKVALVAAHKRQHMQLLAAQQTQGVVSPGGTAGNNEPGQVGLSALEGGVV